ncbi:MAG: cytochrome B [Candidatus Puniceispirillum sp.]|jgi:cytochrome b|uniref:cytochrome b/b6 domain-containing protein n=1 Tax=Candidatus Puniceispirillum sp. TaxID=2026719 RepID=UPI001ECB296D|nr:cytochrome B [Candidatus Puniceispirillum sp.]MBT6415274.1 cytochrome B [Candidatus Puniceispirillum sp.]MBT6565572.1 cytochrome B [Candidatus Puniceispirillum sp.]
MRVWDLPLRLFHWGLAISVIGAIMSAKIGVLVVHERFGLAVMALVGWRIIWGFLGGHHARFANFLRGPLTVIAWVRGEIAGRHKVRGAGHSPLAGYAVMALLMITWFMAFSGSISTDGILFDGPLAHLLPAFNKTANSVHHFGERLLFLIILLHIGAILVYKFVKKRDLTMAMVKGQATDEAGTIEGSDGSISRNRTICGVLLMVAMIAGAQMLTLLRPALF